MKKIVSLILMVTLLVSLVPTGVSAYNEDFDAEWIADEFQSVFSEKISRKHPHEGYYYTNSGEEVYLEFAYNPRCSECVENLCYEYDAHSCLSEYQEIDDYVHFSCFCGKTIKVAYTKLEKFFNDRREDTAEICRDINYDLADAKKYDVRMDNIIYNEESTLTGNFDLPKTLLEGSVYQIAGEVNSNYLVDLIDVYVADYSGTIVQQSQIHPNSFNVVISESTKINEDLSFNELKSGTYTLYIDLSDVSGATGNASAVFDVISNSLLESSTLTIDFTRLPVTITENYFGLRGSIYSNYTITDVYGYVKDQNGYVRLSSHDVVNSKYMDIQHSNLNNALEFGKLENGTYTIETIARDSSGAETNLSHIFSVNRTKIFNEDVKKKEQNVHERNELSEYIIYDNNYSPTYMDINANNVEIKDTAYDVGKTVGKSSKGDTFYFTGRCTNKYGNTWYIMNYSGKKAFVWSGHLSAHKHSYDKITVGSSSYNICSCGDVETISGNTQMSSIAISAATLAAVDGPFPVGDLTACALTLGSLYLSMLGVLPSVDYIASAISSVDFDNYLKKRSENICSQYSFRKVQRFNGGLKYIDKYCMDAAEAYIYLTTIGGDLYTESEDSAMMLVAQLQGAGICERDKDKKSYFYHWHLGTERESGAHIFFGTNDFGDVPH